MATCWRCGAETSALTCESCGSLQPPNPDLDHFERLGVERRYAIDRDAVVAAHRTLQRRLHPDRFVGKSAQERRLSMEHAAALNDALRTLSDPVERAEYMLAGLGVDLQAEGEGRVRLAPAFLMEVMEIREALGELDGTDAHVERAQVGRDVAARFEATVSALGEALDADAPPDDGALEALAQRAAQLRYLRRILEEVETAGEPPRVGLLD